MGEYTISESVINSLVYNVAKKFEGIKKVVKVRNKNLNDGVIIEIEIMCLYGYNLMEVMSKLAEKIKVEIDRMTALNIEKLNIETKSIVMDKDEN